MASDARSGGGYNLKPAKKAAKAKPKGKTPAFAQPLATQAEPFRLQRREQQGKTKAAARELGSDPKLTKLRIKTSGAGATEKDIRKTLKEVRGKRSYREMYVSSNLGERRYLNDLARQLIKPQIGKEFLDAGKEEGFGPFRRGTPGRPNPKPLTRAEREAKQDKHSKLRDAKTSSQGFGADKAWDLVKGIGKAIGATGEATYHDPVGVPVKTIKQASRALPAILPSIADTVLHPVKTATDVGESLDKRNTETYKERVKRIREEGALEDIGDIGLAVGAGGVLKTALRTGSGRPATERPAIRISGDTLKQPKDRGPLRTAVGNADAKRRAGKQEARLVEAEAGGKPIDAVEFQAAQANRAAGKVVEVKGRLAGPRQSRGVAMLRGRGIYAQKRDDSVRSRDLNKAINKLSKKEKAAHGYALELGIRTPEQAKTLLPLQLDIIRKERETKNTKVKGSLKKSDELPRIEAMLADPKSYFTPRLAETLEGLRPDLERAGREDPRYPEAQIEQRIYQPLREVLPVERGVAEPPAPKTVVRQAALPPLLRTATSSEDLRVLFSDDPAGLADNLDLDTVTDAQMKAARAEVQRATQASLQQRGLPAEVVVYRKGDVKPGEVQSFSLKPVAQYKGQHAYRVRRDDILADSNAFFPSAHVLEHEVLIDSANVRVERTPNDAIKAVAEKYLADSGVEARSASLADEVDPAFAQRVAGAFDDMKHDPTDPEVKASYDAMKVESMTQYEAAIAAGYKFEFYPDGVDPYPGGPREALKDLRENKHLYVFPTERGFGDDVASSEFDNHPLLEEVPGLEWGGRAVTYNDVFRAIHDLYGHGKEGNGFRAVGEDNAWRQHSAMFSPLARRAMTTETRGQNSWVNYGPHGEKNRTAKQDETVYADQKAGLLPEWVSEAPAPELPPLRYAPEEGGDFLDRVKGVAHDDLGLAKPIYFKSERYADQVDFGAKTLGGIKAMADDKRNKGVNLREGLRDMSPAVLARGLSRNIKAKHNFQIVNDIAEANVIRELAGGPEGSTPSAIYERASQAGVALPSFALWNPGLMKKTFGDGKVSHAEDFGMPEEFEAATLVAALQHSTIQVDAKGNTLDGAKHAVDEQVFERTSGWFPVPARVMKELEAQMVPSTLPERMWSIMKGKSSRMILLTGNIPWLSFQVASNLGAATVAAGEMLRPVGTYKWWRDKSEADRQQEGAKLGLDATASDAGQIKLGAATDRGFVNGYREFKAHPFWHTGVAKGRGPSISQLNPLELMARADRAQTNAFRLMAGYSLARRDAMKRMGESMGRADAAQAKLVTVLGKPKPDAADIKIAEAHAEAVVDWMGDYTTRTAGEKRYVNQLVMFYPYMRYSLRLLFYTMPVKHPLASAVIAELAQLKADELAELFGEDALPWNSGKIIFSSDGELMSIDLRKANPALNALMEAVSKQSLSGMVGILPPVVGWTADQAYQETGYKGEDWKIHGKPAPYGGHDDVRWQTRARILGDDVGSLMFPYRLAKDLTQDGPQGDDSTLFEEKPTHYAGTTPVGKLQKKFADRQQRFDDEHDSIIGELIPLLPRHDRSDKRKDEAEIIKKATPKPGAKVKTKSYFGSGGTRSAGGSKKTKYFGTSQ